MPVPARELYAWHARPGAFERLAPPWERIEVIERRGTIDDGDVLVMRLRKGPFRIRWRAVHEEHVPGEQFVDRQERGPFARWRHRHRFLDSGDGSVLEDHVEYRLPVDRLVRPLAGAAVERQVRRMFEFRHRRTRRDLARHAGGTPLRIGLTGGRGTVGAALRAFLGTGGHEVVGLAWSPEHRGWVAEDRLDADGPRVVDLQTGRYGIDADAAAGLDAVVHLEDGEPTSVPDEAAVLRSRRLAEGIARIDGAPKSLIVLSSVACYDPGGDGAVREDDAAGTGAPARRWVAREAATATAAEAGIRVVALRCGAVLGLGAAPLSGLVGARRLGVRVRGLVGDRPISWISLDDLLGTVLWALRRAELVGVVHAVAPDPLRGDAVEAALSAGLGGVAWLPVPRTLKRAFPGDTVSSLDACRRAVLPGRLPASGFEHLDPDPERTLRFQLGHPAGEPDATP